MTDALRSDRSSPARDAPDRERDARVDELLLAGLDHYFSGRHELAISIWTRVLFIDRGHAKARAYIERARGAVAERQREGDELFHTGEAALRRGDRAAARRLLTSAVERGASDEDALALLHRLDRLDAASQDDTTRKLSPPSPPARAGGVVRPAARDPRVAWLAGGVLTGVLLAAVAGAYLWIVADPFDFGAARTTLPPVVEDPLPVPSPGDILLMRARDLVAKGRLREALSILDGSLADERHRESIDELRGTIQRRLLDAARRTPAPSSSPPPESPAPRPPSPASPR